MPAGEQMGDGHDPRCHGADDCTCDCWSCADQRSHEPAPDPADTTASANAHRATHRGA